MITKKFSLRVNMKIDEFVGCNLIVKKLHTITSVSTDTEHTTEI